MLPSPATKIHRLRYVNFGSEKDTDTANELLAASTEDGRVILYSTKETHPSDDAESLIPDATVRAQLGGKPSGLGGRVKDFEILSLTGIDAWRDQFVLLACGSDGAFRVWLLRAEELQPNYVTHKEGVKSSASTPRQIGTLLDTYETGDRITCMVAFVMQQPEEPSATGDSASESDVVEEDGEEDDSDSEVSDE